MIDFRAVVPRTEPVYSFVGLKKEAGVTYFFLPRGYPTDLGPDALRHTFFALYKAMRAFSSEADRRGSGWAEKIFSKEAERDGALRSRIEELGSTADWRRVLGYAPLTRLDRLLEEFDEMSVFNLVRRRGRIEYPDWSRMDDILARGTFLPGGEVMVDDPLGERPLLERGPSPIVALYCYLYAETVKALGQGHELRPEVLALAEELREEEGLAEDALFGLDTAEATHESLIQFFERCESNTSYKDDDYARFADACASFLFDRQPEGTIPEEVIWGMDRFWPVWEALAISHLIRQQDITEILFLDPGVAVPLQVANALNFNIPIRDGEVASLRPDCMVRRSFNPTFEFQMDDPGWNEFGWYISYNVAFGGEKFSARIAPVGVQGTVQKLLAPECADGEAFSVDLNALRAVSLISRVGPISGDPEPTPAYFFLCVALNDILLDGWRSKVAPEKFSDHLHSRCGTSAKSDLGTALVRVGMDGRGMTMNALPDRYARRCAFFDCHAASISAATDALTGLPVIVDAKYHDIASLLTGADFRRAMSEDVQKQMVYEWQAKRCGYSAARSEFWLPGGMACDHDQTPPSVWSHIRLRTIDVATAAEDYASLVMGVK